MHITFAPVRQDVDLLVEKRGEVLILNGQDFDFGPLQEGAELPADAMDSTWFAGPVARLDGILHVHLVLPHGADAPKARLFPVSITQSADGVIALPADPSCHQEPFCS